MVITQFIMHFQCAEYPHFPSTVLVNFLFPSEQSVLLGFHLQVSLVASSIPPFLVSQSHRLVS